MLNKSEVQDERLMPLIKIRQSGYRLYSRKQFIPAQVGKFLELVKYSSTLKPDPKSQGLSGFGRSVSTVGYRSASP